jgi:hypothetical protein
VLREISHLMALQLTAADSFSVSTPIRAQAAEKSVMQGTKRMSSAATTDSPAVNTVKRQIPNLTDLLNDLVAPRYFFEIENNCEPATIVLRFDFFCGPSQRFESPFPKVVFSKRESLSESLFALDLHHCVDHSNSMALT